MTQFSIKSEKKIIKNNYFYGSYFINLKFMKMANLHF